MASAAATVSFWLMYVSNQNILMSEKKNPEDQSFHSASVNQTPANKIRNDLYPVCLLL